MENSTLHKINTLKTMASMNGDKSRIFVKTPLSINNDSLSKSIRSKKDAKLFREEFKLAVKLAMES